MRPTELGKCSDIGKPKGPQELDNETVGIGVLETGNEKGMGEAGTPKGDACSKSLKTKYGEESQAKKTAGTKIHGV